MSTLMLGISLGLLGLEIFLSVSSVIKRKNYLSWLKYVYLVIAFLAVILAVFCVNLLNVFDAEWQLIVDEGLVGSEGILGSAKEYKNFIKCFMSGAIIVSITYISRFIFCIYQKIKLRTKEREKDNKEVENAE